MHFGQPCRPRVPAEYQTFPTNSDLVAENGIRFRNDVERQLRLGQAGKVRIA
jgi:hypothetical protein